MALWSKWMSPGLKLKRWVVLLFLSIILLSAALSGMMGRVFTGLRLELVHPHTLDRWTRQVQSLRFVDFALLACGAWGVIFSLRRLTFAVLTVAAPGVGGDLDTRVARVARLNRGPRIVTIGGGTGLPNLLAGLKGYTSHLTAVVTVADDGGSSGRLRQDLKMLPPGDLRNCLLALAETEPLMQKLFQHRFSGQGGLEGHSFGNLFIAAMTEVTGDFGEAIRASSKVLAIQGNVLPVTLNSVSLVAELEDGRTLTGESSITAAQGRIRRLTLEPADIAPNPEVLEAIAQADAIVLGPGSLYTSILPNLLVPGVAQAVSRSSALKAYVCNVMTQPGESDGLSVAGHLRALREQTGKSLVDYVIANTEAPSAAVAKRYAEKGQRLVEVDKEAIAKTGTRLIKARLLETREGYVRHHPARLARAVLRLIVI